MVITCPQCSTRFKIADHLVKDKPVKLKCSKCKHVFRFARAGAARPSHPCMPVVKPPVKPEPEPSGEPADEARVRPSHPRMPVVKPPARPEQPEVAPFESFEPEPSGEPADEAAPEPEQPSVASFESFEPEPAPEPPPEPTADDVDPGDAAPSPSPEPAGPEPTVDDVDAQDVPVPPEPSARPPGGADAPDAAPVSVPTLTLEDVLPEPEPPSRAGRIVGIAGAALLGVMILLVLFVLYRTAWDVGYVTSDPVAAVKVALGQTRRVLVDDEARGIEASVVDSYKAITGDEREIFVVDGEVLNTTVFPKRMVTVRVSILGSTGEVVKTQDVLAGVTLRSKSEMKSRSFLEMDDELRRERQDAGKWVIRANRKANFQAIFVSYPPGVQDISLYSIVALVVDAQNAEAR